MPRNGSFTTTYRLQQRIRTDCNTASRYRCSRPAFRRAPAFPLRPCRSSIPTGSRPPAARRTFPLPSCDVVHAPRPDRKRGVAVYPHRQRDESSPCKFEAAITSGNAQFWGTTSEMFRPLEDSAESVVGATRSTVNGTLSHSTIGPTCVCAWSSAQVPPTNRPASSP